MTVHHIQRRGRIDHFTARVEKTCAQREECLKKEGCQEIDGGARVCGTCCTKSYCNEGVPWDENEVTHIGFNRAFTQSSKVCLLTLVLYLTTH